MAIGDIKGPEAVVIEVTAGAAVTVGQVVHLVIADGLWDPAADTNVGKFGVAMDAAAENETMRVVIWGRVEVTATNATIAKGALVMAGSTGLVAIIDATGAGLGEVCGTAMEAFTAEGSGTVWIGLGA